jgi:hypothetical protein
VYVDPGWFLVGLLFVAAAAVWIVVPRYRRSVIIRAGLAIPLAAFATMLAIAIVASWFWPDF